MDDILHRLERIENKLDQLTERVAGLSKLCPEREKRLDRLEKEVYGNGGPGIKARVFAAWLIGSMILGAVLSFFGGQAAAWFK